MADISQIQISNTVYDIKDNPARTEISEMPHATSGTIGGWSIYDTYLESKLEDAREKMELYSSSLTSPSRPAIMGWMWNDTSEDYDDQTLLITSSSIYVESFTSEEGYFEDLSVDDLTINGNVGIGGTLVVSDDITSSKNIFLANNEYLQGTDVNGTHLILAGISGSNQVIYGDTSYDTLLNGSSIYLSGTTSVNGALAVTGATTLSNTLSVSGDITSSGHIYLANGKTLYGKDTDGSNYILVSINTSNENLLGNTTYPTYIRGSTNYLQGATSLNSTLTVSGNITGSGVIYLANNKALYVKDTDGTNRYIAGLNSSNQNLLGNTTYPTYIRGSTNYLQGATSLNSTLAVSGATTLSSSLTVSGTIYKGSLATKQIVGIQFVTVSASETIASGSSTSLTGTFTAVSGASYAFFPRGLNYGYFMGTPTYSGTTITATGYNSSGGTHTLSGTIVVLAYV